MSSGADNARWFWPAGTLNPSGGVELVVDDSIEGWRHTGLLVATLDADESVGAALKTREAIVVPLSGGVTIEVDGATVELTGRASVCLDISPQRPARDAAIVGEHSDQLIPGCRVRDDLENGAWVKSDLCAVLSDLEAVAEPIIGTCGVDQIGTVREVNVLYAERGRSSYLGADCRR